MKKALVVPFKIVAFRVREIFVTSKLWNTNHNYEQTRQAFEESLESWAWNIWICI